MPSSAPCTATTTTCSPFPNYFLDDFSPLAGYTQSYRIFFCPGRDNPHRKNPTAAALYRETDYLYFPGSFVFQDIEKNALKNNGKGNGSNKDKNNNGHGNNESAYHFDPSNPTFVRLLLRKIDYAAVYDRHGPSHFSSINLAVVEDAHSETRPHMRDLWTLTSDGKLNFDLDTAFPD